MKMTHKYRRQELSIFIISLPHSSKGQYLESQLRRIYGLKPFRLEGVTPNDLPCASTQMDHFHQGKIRLLSCVEVATALSHQRAREFAYRNGSDWNLILEDDSELITEKSYLLSEIIKDLSPDISNFVHLFPEQNGLLAKSSKANLLKIVKVPDYANAYLLNRCALSVILPKAKNSHTYLADWPRMPRQLNKWASAYSVFRHPTEEESPSSITESRFRLQGNARNFRIFFLLKQTVFKHVSKFLTSYGDQPIKNEQLRTVILW